MGASGWSYFVPYEADIETALQRLRKDVFDRGEYVYGTDITEDQLDALLKDARVEMDEWKRRAGETARTLPEPLRTYYRQGAEEVEERIMSGRFPHAGPKIMPKTIEQLLEFQAEEGTHSILDIVGISKESQFGNISPFPRAELIEYFGSETPSHAEIQAAYDSGSLEDFVHERWQGIYLIAYQDGVPSEIFFAGCSGD